LRRLAASRAAIFKELEMSLNRTLKLVMLFVLAACLLARAVCAAQLAPEVPASSPRLEP
jgi:hypothetical protein